MLLSDKARGESLDSIVAKALTRGGKDDEAEEAHEDMVRGIGLVSYEGEHN